MDILTHLHQGASPKAAGAKPGLSGSAAGGVDALLPSPDFSFADALQAAVGHAAQGDSTDAGLIEPGLDALTLEHVAPQGEVATNQLAADATIAMLIAASNQPTTSSSEAMAGEVALAIDLERGVRAHDAAARVSPDVADGRLSALTPHMGAATTLFSETASASALSRTPASADVDRHETEEMQQRVLDAASPVTGLAPSVSQVHAAQVMMTAVSIPSHSTMGPVTMRGLAVDQARPMRLDGGPTAQAAAEAAGAPSHRSPFAWAPTAATLQGMPTDPRDPVSVPNQVEGALVSTSPVALAPTAQERIEDTGHSVQGIDARIAALSVPPAVGWSAEDAAEHGLAGQRTEALELADGAPKEILATDHGMPNVATRANVRSSEFLAVVAEFQVAEPVTGEHFASALGTRLTTMIRDGVHEARLQLNPAELGPVLVRIAVDGDAARIDFHAQLPSTRHSLESSIPTLAAALRDSGLTLSGGGVFQQPGDQASSAQDYRGRGDQAQGQRNTQDASMDAPAMRVTSITRERRGLVDLVA